MQKLTQTDAGFLYAETTHAPMHLCSFHVYSPAADGSRMSFDDFVEHVRSRLPLARVLRRKLARVPFDLDYPYWIEDRDFDLDQHVRRATVPAPGDWRAAWDLAAALHSKPVDLTRPPWELYMIDGLERFPDHPPGGFGMLIKVHHCAIDGMSGIELMNALHDTDAEGRAPITDTWQGEWSPGAAGLLGLTLASAVTAPGRAVKFLTRSLPAAGPLPAVRAAWGRTAGAPRPPATRLNQRVTTNRVGDATVLDLADVKQVRKALPGTTVNDVLLAVVGGGIRRYLSATDDLPAQPMLAGVPISTRTDADAGTAGNMISMMIVTMGTDVEGARDRLAAIQRSTSTSKEQSQGVGARVLAEGAELFPGALLGLAVRASAQNARVTTSQIGNVCVTNVPGSQVPLYMRGARMEAYYSLGPVYDNAGPIHLIVSYQGKVYLSATSCQELVPDIEFYVQCMRDSWDDLVAETVGAANLVSRGGATARKRTRPAPRAKKPVPRARAKSNKSSG